MKDQMLFAIDLDGTLLRDDKTISTNSINTLRDAQKEHYVTFMTGRGYIEAKKYIEMIGLNGYVICNDGLNLYTHDGHLIHSNENLLAEDIQTIKKELSFGEYCLLFWEGEEYLLADGLTSLIVWCIKRIKKRTTRLVSWNFVRKKCENTDVEKVLINSYILKRKYTDIKCALSKRYNVYLLRDERKIQIMNSNVNKKNELLYLADYLRISEERVYVFGNDGNDESVVEYFQNSFAVANAQDIIKQKAKNVIASNNDEGVCKKIECIIKGENV